MVSDCLERPPRSQKEPLLYAHVLGLALLWYSIIESVASMSAYFFVNCQHDTDSEIIRSVDNLITGL